MLLPVLYLAGLLFPSSNVVNNLRTIVMGLGGLVLIVSCLFEFYAGLVELFSLPISLYTPINMIVAILRGITGNFIPVQMIK